jgi:hypothetical protein
VGGRNEVHPSFARVEQADAHAASDIKKGGGEKGHEHFMKVGGVCDHLASAVRVMNPLSSTIIIGQSMRKKSFPLVCMCLSLVTFLISPYSVNAQTFK